MDCAFKIHQFFSQISLILDKVLNKLVFLPMFQPKFHDILADLVLFLECS